MGAVELRRASVEGVAVRIIPWQRGYPARIRADLAHVSADGQIVETL